MKTLEKVINHKGFILKQLKRVGSKAIYEQTKKGYTHRSYEVIKIGKHDGYTIGGQFIKAAETYPGGSQWGISGWTFQNIKDAEAKFKKL